MADAGAPPAGPSRAAALPMAGLAVLLLILTTRQIYDLDHGFYIAAGREILASGIPRTEIWLPLLEDRPFASLWLGSAPLFAAAWEVFGPAGLVGLKVLGYGGGFYLAALAALRRRATPWLAALATALCATAVSSRFVERPGLFSALFLGILLFVLHRPEGCRAARWSLGRWRDPMILVLLTVWSTLHAEWFLGVGVAALLRLRGPWDRKRLTGLRGLLHDLRDRDRGLGTGLWLVAWLAAPALLFALLHPAGVRPLVAPFGFLAGGSGIPVQEYAVAGWRTMPGAVVLLLAMAAGAVCYARRGLLEEAILLGGLVLLSLAVRRAALPAALVAVPLLAPLVTTGRIRPTRAAVLGFLLSLAAVMAQWAVSPWFRPGVALDETLDTRGVGAVLDGLPGREGTVLAEFGWASLLLSSPGVVRQGVVMDGRQEAFPPGFFADVYTPCFRPGPGWAEALRRADVAFYVEPQRIRPSVADLVPAFEAAGWRLVAWDNSSRLVVRADVAERHGLGALRVDPSHLDAWERATPEELEAALAEVRSRTEALEAAGLPSTLGRLALARLELLAGRPEAAEAELARAPTGSRFASFRELRRRVLTMQGRLEEAARE